MANRETLHGHVGPEKVTLKIQMRDRRLTRSEALEEYLVYQIRLYEYLHCFQIIQDMVEDKYKPESSLGHGSTEFLGTLRNTSYGLFASLMDAQNMALDVFDVWVVLYPGKEARIIEVWKKVEPYIQLIRDFRNDVAFHANKNLRRYFETRRLFKEKRKEVIAAMQEFWGLAAELIREQDKALPNFRNEIEPFLKKAVPGASGEEIERLKDFFIQNKSASKVK
jgi:hypothetical protein